jgi:(S)-mandelate dehydrogenase
VVTTDANVFGWREWDRRQFRAPGELTFRALLDVALHPRWLFNALVPQGVPKLENVADFFPKYAQDTRAAVTHIPTLFAPTVTWRSIAALRHAWQGKLLVKGILDVEDAKRARDCGCDGIVVGNHGARHLDSVVSPLDVLPAISREVGNDLAVIVDSGFRRGSDILKGVALGAHAVMLGRAPLYGLAAGGQAGASHALSLLQAEIHRVMGQIGCNSLDELGPAWLLRADPATRS